jgi:hypothetical protein
MKTPKSEFNLIYKVMPPSDFVEYVKKNPPSTIEVLVPFFQLSDNLLNFSQNIAKSFQLDFLQYFTIPSGPCTELYIKLIFSDNSFQFIYLYNQI